jgi:DNA-binding transcriptional MocR family regulator
MAPLCTAYARKSAVLVASLRENGFEVAAEPRGGFFVWARLPSGCPYGATALLSFAEANHQVSFLPGPRCRSKEEDKALPNDLNPAAAEELDRWVRLCFAMLDETQLKEGAGRLAAACRP